MVVGHQKQLDYLYRSSQNGSINHAYIFAGPNKVGKKTAAFEWLSHLFSRNLRQDLAHPDFSFVGPLTDPKTGQTNKEIEIGQIGELIRKLQLKPALVHFKAAVIDQAHLLNSESQNALLKTLEEPPGEAIIVLIADNALRLLPTIISRCEVVRFHFVSKSQMARLAKAKKIDADEARLELMLNLSLGRPGRLLDFTANVGEFDAWQAKLKQCERIASSGLPERFAYVKAMTDDKTGADINELLELWQYFFRQKLLETTKLGVEPLTAVRVRP